MSSSLSFIGFDVPDSLDVESINASRTEAVAASTDIENAVLSLGNTFGDFAIFADATDAEDARPVQYFRWCHLEDRWGECPEAPTDPKNATPEWNRLKLEATHAYVVGSLANRVGRNLPDGLFRKTDTTFDAPYRFATALKNAERNAGRRLVNPTEITPVDLKTAFNAFPDATSGATMKKRIADSIRVIDAETAEDFVAKKSKPWSPVSFANACMDAAANDGTDRIRAEIRDRIENHDTPFATFEGIASMISEIHDEIHAVLGEISAKIDEKSAPDGGDS